MSLLLGIDLGTSYFKVGLFDEKGALRGLGRVAVEMDTPQAGRSELPVPRFWAHLRRGLSAALNEAGAQASDIAGLSYSSQANTFVLLDERDQPLTPLVSWTDLRAEPIDSDLEAFSRTESFARTVGLAGWSAGFAVAKWRWWQRRDPATWGRVRRALTISDYLTYALAGQSVGDASTAALLGLFDLNRREWWSEAIAFARIESDKLAHPVRPGTKIGNTVSAAADFIGLPSGIPLAVGGLDHHVAALGAGLGSLADLSLSTGTVLAAITLVSVPSPLPGCYHGPHFDGVRFFRLAFDGNGAGQLESYQRAHGGGLSVEELLELARKTPPGAARPLDLATADRGTAVRYLLEKIASTHRGLIGHVATDGGISRIVATGGGARSPLWLQIKADMFGVPVMAPPSVEPACLGAALLASVAAGRHRDLTEAAGAMITPGKWYEPNAEATARYRDWVP